LSCICFFFHFLSGTYQQNQHIYKYFYFNIWIFNISVTIENAKWHCSHYFTCMSCTYVYMRMLYVSYFSIYYCFLLQVLLKFYIYDFFKWITKKKKTVMSIFCICLKWFPLSYYCVLSNMMNKIKISLYFDYSSFFNVNYK
jgi:hypothetical protein